MMISFNKPFVSGKELEYVMDACKRQQIAGGGYYTRACHQYFQEKYHFKKVLLTTSCTDALEMSAILLDIQPGDEVIIPSYTFVSTANAFILRGAKIIFIDSLEEFPNLDIDAIETLITTKTKAIVAVHYAGVACKMKELMELAEKHNIFVVEDAAQAIDSTYEGKPLGGIGHLGCFSFHETKNISAGEGGLLIINDERFIERASIIWEKGTNRSAFSRGEVKKYEWMDVGSSFLPSELTAAFLFAQLESLDMIQAKRKKVWEYYREQLSSSVQLATIPSFASNNAHIFFLVCKRPAERKQLLDYLKKKNIQATSHYLPLHLSKYYAEKHDGRELPHAVRFSNNILRLPLYFDLTVAEQDYIIEHIHLFMNRRPSMHVTAPHSNPVISISDISSQLPSLKII